MDYEKLKAAVWPIVALRIAAYVVFIAAVLGVTLPGRLDEYAALLLSFVFVLYLIVYGSVSLIIQVTAFIVNYKGRTVDHYYETLFKKR